MKTIIALGGSNSKQSINKALAGYAASLVEEVTINVLDLNDYNLPLYGIDEEQTNGVPEDAQALLKKIQGASGIVLSLAEHNGAYTTAFKNAFDWMSRIDGKLWHDIPMLLLATSPGARGGQTVLEIAKGRFPYMGGNIVADFSLPSFQDNFKEGSIVSEAHLNELKEKVALFSKAI